jgi:hypothetical protein
MRYIVRSRLYTSVNPTNHPIATTQVPNDPIPQFPNAPGRVESQDVTDIFRVRFCAEQRLGNRCQGDANEVNRTVFSGGAAEGGTSGHVMHCYGVVGVGGVSSGNSPKCVVC